MRISDWSSDVCSSDLLLGRAVDRFVTLARHEDLRGASARDEPMHHCPDEAGFSGARRSLEQTERAARKDRSKCGPLPAIERIGIEFAVCRRKVLGCRLLVVTRLEIVDEGRNLARSAKVST